MGDSPVLTVTVLEASGLKNVDKKGKSDPYAKLHIDGVKEQHKTKTIKDNLNPQWNETFTFTLSGPLSSATPPLQVTVMDKEKRASDKLLGRATVPLNVLLGDKQLTKQYGLQEGDGRIKLKIAYSGPVDKTSKAPEGNLGGDEAARRAQNATGNTALKRSNLSTRPQEFQVRVLVIEGRSLFGNKNLKPNCKITVGDQHHRTRTQRGTNAPWFNETFFFNLKSSLAKLYDTICTVEVYNAQWGRDPLIGSFTMDLGLVYAQDNHHVCKKWVMLSNPKNRSGGVMGYVKLSIAIVGEGDTPPIEPEPEQNADEDIESNMLRPPGVTVEQVDMGVRVYRGEDIPKMDLSFKTGFKALDKLTRQEGKQDCDPFMKVHFAGRHQRTSTQENTYFPVWMEELHIPASVPSLADKVIMRLFDDDPGFLGNADDVIATEMLSISEISYTDPEDDLGFQPTFGPSWVNFYGSTREFSKLCSSYNEKLNHGEIEGCGYRGRCLVEIVSQAGADKTEKKATKIETSEQKRLVPYMNRSHRYMLEVELLDMTMLSEEVRNGHISVEVSMGVFGTSESTEDAVNSVSAPTMPEKDSSSQFYVAWEKTKPLLELESSWEDVAYRYRTMNYLKFLSSSLADIVRLCSVFDAERDIEEGIYLDLVDDVLLALKKLRAIMTDKEFPLPSLPADHHTRLDLHLFNLRASQLDVALSLTKAIIADIEALGPRHIEAIVEERKVENLKNVIDALIYEPQLSIPDVIMWVITDKKRTAYLRFPVTDIMFGEGVYCGRQFDEVQTHFLKLPKERKGGETKANDVPAQIQFRARFGDKHLQKLWPKKCGERVELCEVYENERLYPTGWGKPARTPHFSDITRKQKRQMKMDVPLPDGWGWKSKWYLSPVQVIEDPEAFVDTVVEEVWQRQRLVPIKGWGKPVGSREYVKDRQSRLGYGRKAKAKAEKKRKKLEKKRRREKEKQKRKGQGGNTSSIGDFLDESELRDDDDDDRDSGDEGNNGENDDDDDVNLTSGDEGSSDWDSDDADGGANGKPNAAKAKSPKKGRAVDDYDDEIDTDWEWVEDEWRVDKQEACDPDGWMYAVSFGSKTFFPAKKKSHFVRKRKYIRTRTRIRKSGGPGENGAAVDSDSDSEDSDARGGNDEDQEEADLLRLSSGDVDDGWRYAFKFGSSMHQKKKKTDFVRVRRYRRELMKLTHMQRIQGSGNIPDDEDDEDDEEDVPNLTLEQKEMTYSSGVYLRYNSEEKYQARLHLYQARGLLAADSTGFSDPYIVMYCGHKSTRSITIRQSVSPLFDQVLTVDNVVLPGDNSLNPFFLPPIILELFDYDSVGSHDFLGRVILPARIRTIVNKSPPELAWHAVDRHGEPAGEVLAAVELVHMREIDNIPLPHQKTVMDLALRKRQRVVPIPRDIRPELRLVRIDVFLWGLRNLAKYKLLNVNQPSITLQCGNFIETSPKLKSFRDDPNFHNTVLSIETLLPTNGLYSPPLIVKVFDNRKFGRKPCVGTFTTEVNQYLYIPKEGMDDVSYDVLNYEEGVSDVEMTPAMALKEAAYNDPDALDDRVDWWSKFYSSQKENDAEELGYFGNFFQIYDKELERVFDMTDVVSSFTLMRGKEGEQTKAGILKAKIAVITDVDKYEKSDAFGDVAKEHESATSNTIDINNKTGKKKTKKKAKTTAKRVLVRVYVIRCLNLQPKDSDGGCDAYVTLKVGKKRVVKDTSNYVPSSLNPNIGQYYDVEMTLPKDTQLTLGIWDRDVLSGDDLVGETIIDIEDRVLSSCRATCGLPQAYMTSGFSRWRDILKPREILALMCEQNSLPAPIYSEEPNNVWVRTALPGMGVKTYACKYFDPRNDMDIKLENAALTALHALDMVPEHVETRNLFNPNQPNISQGQVQMWVDIFPLTDQLSIPEPISISPREPKEYELRVVVYNAYSVPLDDRGLGGQKMSDIYIKGFLRGMEANKDRTDTHYRSLNGEGNFNWRLKFKFLYIPAEQKIVVKKKRRTLSSGREAVRYPPILTLQVWDNDLFSADDVLGAIDLNLLELPHGFKLAKKCVAYNDKYHEKHGFQDLFKQKTAAGVFPCKPPVTKDSQPTDVAGKLEIEIELLTKDEAEAKENGRGRKSPNQFPKLAPPKRPPTSFFWLTSPWKAFRYIIWANYKWKILLALLILVLIAFIVLIIYNAPFHLAGVPFGGKN